MPLQGFVDGTTPVIGASWLNRVDALLVTVFNDAVTPAQALIALGATATGIAIITAPSQAAAQTGLGMSAVGRAIATAATTSLAQDAIGMTATGKTVATAATAAAARTALGSTAVGDAVFTAVDAAAARTAIGVTGASAYDLLVACGDETTTIVVASGVTTFVVRRAITLSFVYASLNVASGSGVVTVDVTKNGVTIFSTLITIDATERDSATAAIPAVLSTTSLTSGDIISVSVTTAGTGAKGLKLEFVGSLT